LKAKVQAAGGNQRLAGRRRHFPAQATLDGLVAQAEQVGLKSYPGDNPDILSLKHTVLFGIKGVSAYADHALILGQEDESVYAFVHEGLAAIQSDDMGVDDWVAMALRCGEAAYKAMELLDAGNTRPTATRCPPRCRWVTRKARPFWFPGTT
jgi:hydroxylamine reductase